MNHPIIHRELVGTLRTRKALALQVGVAATSALLVLARWPSDSRVGLSGAEVHHVFHLFGYGLLAAVVFLAPAFPATSIVREVKQGTLELLLNSPMKPASIYFGKLIGTLAVVLILLTMTVPAAAACYAMAGISLSDQLLALYVILAVSAVQYSTLGLLVSTCANSTDSALRITYTLVLLMAVVTLGPHQFLQGGSGFSSDLAAQVRCVSPLPAVMEVLGHGDAGSAGLISSSGAPALYVLYASLSIALFMIVAVLRLNHAMLDRSRPEGVITDDRSRGGRLVRRLVFVVDPQRRKRGIPPLVNPVMVKEFRSRRFGRSHWMFRLIALCSLVSLGLTYATTAGTIQWSVEMIGGIMVLLQSALIVLLTPSLAAGLISSERESGGWQLLQMTPLSARAIVAGKLMSVVWTLILILFATLPGYLVIIVIEPQRWGQISRVLACLVLLAVFALLLSAAISSICRKTVVATTLAYAILVGICAGTLVVWLGRDAPFGYSTVEAALRFNPVAAALCVNRTPGFTEYDLIPVNWWITGYASLLLLAILGWRTWRLTRPE